MEEQSKCEISINSVASLNLSRRDLVRMLDRISYLDDSLKSLQKDQADLQTRISEMEAEASRLRVLFDTLFGEQLKGVVGAEQVRAELSEERRCACPTPGQITLMTEPDREQMLSIIDAIRRVSEERQGPAPKDEVSARAREIGIKRDGFEDILERLKRSGALIEYEGRLKLI